MAQSCVASSITIAIDLARITNRKDISIASTQVQALLQDLSIAQKCTQCKLTLRIYRYHSAPFYRWLLRLYVEVRTAEQNDRPNERRTANTANSGRGE